MRRRITLTLVVCAILSGNGPTAFCQNGDLPAFDHDHSLLTDILREFVVDGIVDYPGLLGDRASLDGYLRSMAGVQLQQFQHWSANQQLAYLINLYNAATLQLIVDNYPVASIKDIGTLFTKPWDLEVVSLFGKTVTLNTIEHSILRKNYNEPRIHFALVCAARGCPPLRNEAYRAEILSHQLDEQARLFFSTAGKNRVDLVNHVAYLSPILKWYGEDFGSSSRQVLDYVSNYFPLDAAAALREQDFAIEYTDYDWSLNDNGQPN